jgi:uncharacterized protein (DUF486 family)
MTKVILTIVLLICSYTFITLAWYGHLKMKEMNNLAGVSLFTVILNSWGIAFFEYVFQVTGHQDQFNKMATDSLKFTVKKCY